MPNNISRALASKGFVKKPVGITKLYEQSSLKIFDGTALLTRRNCGQSLKYLVERLNPMMKGWFGYFKHAKGGIFAKLDGFVRRRLRSILCKQNKLGYYHTSHAISRRWPNAYFAKLGLFTLHEARAAASQSR